MWHEVLLLGRSWTPITRLDLKEMVQYFAELLSLFPFSLAASWQSLFTWQMSDTQCQLTLSGLLRILDISSPCCLSVLHCFQTNGFSYLSRCSNYSHLESKAKIKHYTIAAYANIIIEQTQEDVIFDQRETWIKWGGWLWKSIKEEKDVALTEMEANSRKDVDECISLFSKWP